MAVLLRRIVYSIATTLLITIHVSCQISNDLDVGDIEKQFTNVPGLENFNSSKLPTADDLERALKEKCEKNGGGEEAYNALKKQSTEIQACIESQVNLTQIQDEIEEAKKTGSMDEVFGKYCKKYPLIHACFEAVTDKIRDCLDTNEQDTLNQTLVIVEELKEFICFKDGDRLAMFIAEGGVECLESKRNELEDCVNKTIGARIPTDFSVTGLPSFIFSKQECNDFDEIRTCVNMELENCKDSTPANIVDAFFKFLKKHMPCDGAEPYSKGSASSIAISSFVVVVSVIVSKFL